MSCTLIYHPQSQCKTITVTTPFQNTNKSCHCTQQEGISISHKHLVQQNEHTDMYIYTVLCIANSGNSVIRQVNTNTKQCDFSISGWKTLKSYYLIYEQSTDRLREQSIASMPYYSSKSLKRFTTGFSNSKSPTFTDVKALRTHLMPTKAVSLHIEDRLLLTSPCSVKACLALKNDLCFCTK